MDNIHTIPSPPPPPPGEIDLEAMRGAWELNVATQRDMIDQMRDTQRDNRRTRMTAHAIALLLIGSVWWIHVRSDEVAAGVREVVQLAKSGDARLESVEQILNLVAGAVVASNEADAVEAEAHAATIAAINAKIEKPLIRRRPMRIVNDAHERVKKDAKRKRIRAHGRAVAAQVALASEPVERANAEARLNKIRSKAHAAGVEVEF